ncbi:MAG: class I SAM-dependent methyltransferase [Kineosporiaceae bacterium]
MRNEPAADSAGAHYFSERPAGAGDRRLVAVRLAGRDLEVVTAPGVFSGDRLDLGTRVLLREAPPPPASGDLLDLGCGWGPLALSLALLSPRATTWAVDVNERGLELTRENARRLGTDGLRAVRPEQVPDDVRFSAIWSNPPIRVGKEALHALLLRWLPRLSPGAQAHLVVQRHLGADSLHSWLAARLAESAEVERAGSAKGYRVLRITARTSG